MKLYSRLLLLSCLITSSNTFSSEHTRSQLIKKHPHDNNYNNVEKKEKKENKKISESLTLALTKTQFPTGVQSIIASYLTRVSVWNEKDLLVVYNNKSLKDHLLTIDYDSIHL